ncbi:MAG: hypothetical protein C0623_01465 [Desulfuromonas sp.]|nr:MAG: hypothetical protein C0623_01465 [Desulfuromonas sp.]
MGLRVFIVEDEESIRDSLQMHLEDQGHEVLTCARPSECRVFSGHECDKNFPCGHALFVDYFMPEMTGLDFIESMEKGGCKGVTRNKIIMTGDSTAVDIDKAESLGCQVVQKPLTLDKLDKIIARIESKIDPGEKLADISKYN